MSAAASPSEWSASRAAQASGALAPIRQVGGTEVTFAARGTETVALERGERGGFRVRIPMSEHGTEAVLMNTGGGLVGGDHAVQRITARRGARALVTTPAAERVYRSLGPPARSDVALSIEADARLAWLPQETLLYDGARLERRLEADVDPTASLLVAELAVLGRRASGETIGSGSFHDRWRLRRGGRLVYAEAARLDGAMSATMARPAIGGGARIVGTAVLVAPDAEDRLEALRAVIDRWRSAGGPHHAAASAWNGMMVVRMLGGALAPLRDLVARMAPLLIARPMPRTWWT